MQAILVAIEQAGVTRLLATAPGLYPIVSALHLLGLALLLGPILVVDWRLTFGRADANDLDARRLQRVAIAGFGLAVATGGALFTTQATKYAENPAFLAKLALIFLAGVNALAFHASGGRLRQLAAASLLLWLAALLAARFIAFV